ncbi:alpha/beta hydrolase [Gulosibacter molinativorax]|uniref:Esterase n=1 Tax=Gulosibacter molinativorax TaxID=256821 RepID=A0ABT7C5A7_9MICO|nr:dienelactone hydrolase family protein [Gulosibacter molinativorax]MDJ1370371.1 esterase [Gulosibacter molinativorax]
MTQEISPAPSSAPIPAAVGPRESGPDGRPLLLFIHGFGSHERDLPGLAPHLGDGWDWLSVRAPYALPTGGAAWFPLSEGGPIDRGAIDAALAGLEGFIESQTSGQPIVPIGFSQGGLMTTELLRSGRVEIAAAAILSGFVDPTPRESDARLLEEHKRVFFGRGTADPIIQEHRFAATEEWVTEFTDATVKVYPGLAHAVSQEELQDLRVFLDGLGITGA